MAIGKIIGPSHIKFVSRISNNRVCIYLGGKIFVDKLIEDRAYIIINDHKLEIKPYIAKAKRVILSNVSPTIPHRVIEEALRNTNININSKITCVKVDLSEEGYSHVLSFRRQFFVPPEEITKLPDSLQINFESNIYRIFASVDNPKCFLCKKEGHLAKHCDAANRVSSYLNLVSESQSDNLNLSPNPVTSTASSDPQVTIENKQKETPATDNIGNQLEDVKSAFKRPLSTVSSTSSRPIDDAPPLPGRMDGGTGISVYFSANSEGAKKKKKRIKLKEGGERRDSAHSDAASDLDNNLSSIKEFFTKEHANLVLD